MPGLFLMPGKCCGCVAPSCLVTFTVTGCNSAVLAGATVSVWTNSGKTVLLDSQTTNGSGVAVVDVVTAGTYYYEVSYPTRMNTSSATVAMTCGGTRGVALTAATGYHCVSFCAEPFKDTLTATFSTFLPTTTITWVSGQTWRGSNTVAFPGCAGCPNPYTVPFTVDFVNVTIGNDALHAAPTCPGTGLPSLGIALSQASLVCPPSLSLVMNINNNALSTCFFGGAPGTVTFTE